MFPTPWKRLRIPAVAALAAAVVLPGAGMAQEKITWRVQTHWPSASSSFEGSLVRIKNKIAECTGDRLILELHEAGALFPAKEIFNAVRRGVIQMGTTSPAYLPATITTAGVAAGLPFAFHHVWEAVYFQKYMNFEQVIRDEVAKQGVYYSTDKVYVTEMVLKKPIESVEDLKQIKIRSAGTLQRFLSEAGAAASYIAGPEIYPALATGVIDGAHWGAAQGASSMGLYEVAKYHVKPPLTISGIDAFIVNQKALDGLPEELRTCVIDELEKQFWARTNEYQFLEQTTLAKAVREQGVKINQLPPEVVAHLTNAAQKIWDDEAKKGPEAAKAVAMIRDLLTQLGHID